LILLSEPLFLSLTTSLPSDNRSSTWWARCHDWEELFNPQPEEDDVTTAHVGERLLTPGEVAALFRVDPKTVTRWATAGRIGSIRTPGGHRRFRESEVKSLLAELTTEPNKAG